MKKCIIALLCAVLLAAILPVAVSASEPPTISVAGAGVITAAPDMATVSLGVTTDATAAAQALQRNNTSVEAVIRAIRALGVAEEDIRTQWFSIHQRWNWRDGDSRPDGYTVNNTVTVTVRNLDIVGEVLGAGVAAGANASSGIQFGILDASDLYLEALALAAQDAQRKANALARALGRTVSGIVTVTETGSFHAPVAREFASNDMAMLAPQASMEVPVQSGEMMVTARVQVVFAVR
ncbi:MAG: SIMPL domain-containing protein [Defluviitaleaceae bacterium]|nr:SIMPL domain-containing protein [Defluviitaleaceae bacterium]